MPVPRSRMGPPQLNWRPGQCLSSSLAPIPAGALNYGSTARTMRSRSTPHFGRIHRRNRLAPMPRIARIHARSDFASFAAAHDVEQRVWEEVREGATAVMLDVSDVE